MEKKNPLENLSQSTINTNKSFEEQLAATENFDDGKVFDLIPENLKTKVPTFFAQGWGRPTSTITEALKTLYETDRGVVTLDHPRQGGVINEKYKNEYPTEELRKATTILSVLDQKKIEQADLIAQSEGCANAIIAATIDPKKFRNIVLVAPAGMVGKDSFLGMSARFLSEQLKDKINKEPKAKESTYIKDNPLRALAEVKDLSSVQIWEMLKNLKAQGVKISIINAVDDRAFPMKRMQKIAKPAKKPDEEKQPPYELDGFYSVKGGHNELYRHPEKYMKLAEGALTDLENKQK